MFIVKYSETDRRRNGKISVRFSPIRSFDEEDEFECKAFTKSTSGSWAVYTRGNLIMALDEGILVYCTSKRASKKKIIKEIRKRKNYSGDFVMFFRRDKLQEFQDLLTKAVEKSTGRYGQLMVLGIDVQYKDHQIPPNVFVKRKVPKFEKEKELRFAIFDKSDINRYLTSPDVVDIEIPIQFWMRFKWIK